MKRLHSPLSEFSLIFLVVVVHLLLLSVSSVAAAAAATAAHDDDNDENKMILVSTEFLDACTEGKVEIVKDMLQQNPTWVKGTSPDGETCLHVAGIYGQAAVTQAVLQHEGADPNTRTTYEKGLRMHPLSWNVFAGHVDTAKVLLEHGADVNLDFDAGGGSNTSTTTIITAMDVVNQILGANANDNENDGSGSSGMEPFQKMKALLQSYNGKTWVELQAAKDKEL
eukprot:CAMPEP_0198154584 /NCGR_PEP_ID=MMETSP1443-20131203/68675_1 /TAXON_ID=186043 /ORGANISM="Entomoneis sp., Strain CCMP2396" /LENGTH=224 /DNA_ID=CAMNT_0043821265 /DNA_START=116 /DNA_END=790 /DNA_ORIENTATION=+